MTGKPLLIVRAFVEPEIRPEFERWYREVHLPHILKIPGIVSAYRCSSLRSGINWVAVYEFRDESAVQEGFGSQEAAQARKDWEHWSGNVRDLSVEVYAQLSPLPAYHYWN